MTVHRASLVLIALIVLLLLIPACGGETEPLQSSPTPPPETSPASAITESLGPVALRLELTGAPWSEKFMQGLSGRTSLEGGMLFDFEETVNTAFQMRETLIPLSIAFVDAEGIIVDIQDMEPLTTDPYPPAAVYRYALEVNQGFFAENGIKTGDRMELQDSPAEGYGQAVFGRQ